MDGVAHSLSAAPAPAAPGVTMRQAASAAVASPAALFPGTENIVESLVARGRTVKNVDIRTRILEEHDGAGTVYRRQAWGMLSCSGPAWPV